MTETSQRPPGVSPLAELEKLVGQEVGVSSWLSVDQEMIDLSVEATGDRQWPPGGAVTRRRFGFAAKRGG
jgi:acyl dehydratase